MRFIQTLSENHRISTQELLQILAESVKNGETEFVIEACGQYDIGGPLWSPNGKELRFTVRNPGQRLGAMMLPNTTVVVEGSAPADVGWLNAGGTLIVKGDVGDTAGHCASSGCIYIAGRAGTRSGSLMKHDPLYSPPELWILKNTGSFSFEFFSGGTAVVCGLGCCDLPSVLGDRPCVGMVGGTIYVRGSVAELPDESVLLALDQNDRVFLDAGLDRFLNAIGEEKHKVSLKNWDEWHKIIHRVQEKKKRPSLREFRMQSWIEQGIFSDIVNDSGEHHGLLGTGMYRLRIPKWQNEEGTCLDCRRCERICPENAIERKDSFLYSSDPELCIGCGLCQGICPHGVWTLIDTL